MTDRLQDRTTGTPVPVVRPRRIQEPRPGGATRLPSPVPIVPFAYPPHATHGHRGGRSWAAQAIRSRLATARQEAPR